MPAPLIQQGATVRCLHGGQATAAVPNPRVTASGAPTSVISGQWTIADCPGIPPSGIPSCATAQWDTGTTRVTSNRQPIVIVGGEATCTPNGTPLIPGVTQLRVTAT
jgi:hypothetical protein